MIASCSHRGNSTFTGQFQDALSCALNYSINLWLVVSNMDFSFHKIWDVILPIDFHIVQRGRYTTNQISISFEERICG